MRGRRRSAGDRDGQPDAVPVRTEELARFLVGRDPLNIEGLWQQLYRVPRWRGGPVLCSAISALDIALWDIKGKVYGQPIWQLLGGACHDRVRMYAHCGGATPEQA